MKISRFWYIIACLLLFIFFLLRDKTVYLPKPYAYERIDLPEHDYVKFPFRNFPYAFDISKYGNVERVIEASLGDYCLNINYPKFKATLQITYKNFLNIEELKQYIKTSKALAYYHRVKADRIREELMTSDSGKHFILIRITGKSPTKLQFFTTDEKKHFIRGAIYFEENCDDEYLEPVTNFIIKDIFEIMDTLEWK